MTKIEAARRLGVPEHHVLAVEEHPAGHVVEVRGGRLMLVSDTVARPYVAEVDDAPAENQAPARPTRRPGGKRSGGPAA